MPYSFDS